MSTSEPAPSVPVSPFDWARQTGQADAVRRALETKLRQRRRDRVRRAGGVVALLVLAAVGTWLVPLVRSTDTITTAARNRQTLALADGSLTELNARSELHTDFRYGRRVVRLSQGEAFFTVVKDTAHPFLVETPAGTVRVTGTRFNVRVTDGATQVTLEEGSVQATPTGLDGTVLKPNEQLVLSAAPAQPRTLSATEMENTLAWRTGRLALDGLTLGEAAARFAAYHGAVIEVAPAVASLPVGGSCPLDDLRGFIDFVKEAFPVNVLAQPGGSYRLIAR